MSDICGKNTNFLLPNNYFLFAAKLKPPFLFEINSNTNLKSNSRKKWYRPPLDLRHELCVSITLTWFCLPTKGWTVRNEPKLNRWNFLDQQTEGKFVNTKNFIQNHRVL